MRKSGFATEYRKAGKFSEFVRRVASLPFVPEFAIAAALAMLTNRIGDMKELGPEIQLFCERLLKYIQKTWLETYGLQDWNLFYIDAQDIPLTNNGNEGTNSRLNSTLTHHAQVYIFGIEVFEELDKAEIRRHHIREFKTKPSTSGQYKKIQIDREGAKKVLMDTIKNRDNLENPLAKEALDIYMGKMGAASAMFGTKKVNSDYSRGDLNAEVDDPEWLSVVEVTKTTSLEKDRPAATSGGNIGEDPGAGEGIAQGAKKKKQGAPELLNFVTIAASMAQTLIELNMTASDALLRHIQAHKLNLVKFGNVRSNGDCFFDSCFNLALHHEIPLTARNPQELRKLAVESITLHPFFEDFRGGIVWLRDIFGSKMKNVREFQKKYKQGGVFIEYLPT